MRFIACAARLASRRTGDGSAVQYPACRAAAPRQRGPGPRPSNDFTRWRSQPCMASNMQARYTPPV